MCTKAVLEQIALLFPLMHFWESTVLLVVVVYYTVLKRVEAEANRLADADFILHQDNEPKRKKIRPKASNSVREAQIVSTDQVWV